MKQEKIKHKVVFLIGNGFDINVLNALNQPKTTSYCHFYEFIKDTHPECDNMLLREMDRKKINNEENWADFEALIDELPNKSEIDESLNEFQDYFSEFLNDIITPYFLRYLDTYAKELNFFNNSIQRFLVDIQEDIKKCSLAKQFDHGQVLDIKFLNFNYTSLLDNLVYIEKKAIRIIDTKSGNNFKFNVNPNLYHEVHRNSTEKWCKLKTEVIHPHGVQQIPRSILFGGGKISGEAYATLSKPLVARYEENFRSVIEDAKLYVIYGMSISKTDLWWWQQIARNISNGDSQLVIYNFLDKKSEYEKQYGKFEPVREQNIVIEKFLNAVGEIGYENGGVSNKRNLKVDYYNIGNREEIEKNIFVVSYFSDEIQPRLFSMKTPE
ncbi:AbiH family protein [Streptococcus suis]|uniref:AbiH family protein n=1 Tax=Streptococcus suis TaxID=1307 RepID=UPI00300FCC12